MVVVGRAQVSSCPPGSGTPSGQCLIVLGHASLCWGSEQWNSFSTPPHGIGQWVVELLLCTASMPWAIGSETPSVHCLTALGQWAVELLLCTVCGVPWCGVPKAPLPKGKDHTRKCKTGGP